MRLRLIYILITLIVIAGLACNLPVALAPELSSGGTPVAAAYLLVTGDPNALPTATPFQPDLPASTLQAPSKITPTIPIAATPTAKT